MTGYHFTDNIYLAPTPEGTFFATSSTDADPIRNLIVSLLSQEETPRPVTGQLIEWTQTSNVENMLSVVKRAQSLSWIEGIEEPIKLPTSGFATMLEVLLASLSHTEQAVLVDETGCTLAKSKLDHTTADLLAAFSTDLIAVHDRHKQRIQKSLDLKLGAWGAMDSAGLSQLGAWPIYIANKRLLLVIPGEPRFNCPEFTLLVWSLIRRYGA